MHTQDTESMESLATWVESLGTDVGLLTEVLESSEAPRVSRRLAARCLDYWSQSSELQVAGIEELRLMDVAMVFRALADLSTVRAGVPEALDEGAGNEDKSEEQAEGAELAMSEGAMSEGAEPEKGESSGSDPGSSTEPAIVQATERVTPTGAEGGDALGVLAHLSEGAVVVRLLLGDDYGRLARFSSDLQERTTAQGEIVSLLDDGSARSQLVQTARAWLGDYLPPAREVDDNALIKLRAFYNAKLPE